MKNGTLRVELMRVMELLHVAEKLKVELRHCWLSDGSQESVAEHTWRLALMVMLVAPQLEQAVDVERCLKMALIHDLAEAETGDIPTFETQGAESKRRKYEAERGVMQRLKNMLGGAAGGELLALWEEYEANESAEARFVRALDKLEVQIQHNEADIETWIDVEKLMVFQPRWTSAYCEFDRALATLDALVKEEAVGKLRANGDNVVQLETEALAG